MSPVRSSRLPWITLLSCSLTACPQATGLEMRQITSGGMLYTVATVDLKRDTLRLHWKNPTTGQPYRTLHEVKERLRKEGVRVLFATNSGIYGPGLEPLGLHVEQGRTLVGINNARSGGNFALLPNGVF